MTAIDVASLIRSASTVRENAYTPYSGFKVGSVLVGEDGTLFAGCNVENSAYGPTNCAERTALFRAIADGCKPGTFRALAVVGDTPHPITPCGTCRQVMAELCEPDMPVYLANLSGETIQTTVAALLPGAFHLPEETS